MSRFISGVAFLASLLACNLSGLSAIQPPHELVALPSATSVPVSVPSARIAVVTALRSVTVRSLPTWESLPVSYMFHNETVRILDCVDGWAKVDGGYINSLYLSVVCEEK
jgi:hypothetical protein